MSDTVRDWLPVGVLESAAVRTKVGGAVEQWSARWFGSRPLCASAFYIAPGTPTPPRAGAPWRSLGRGLAVGATPGALSGLVDWALDSPVEKPAPTPADKRLLEGFEAKLLDDLARSLALGLGLTLEHSGGDAVPQDPFEGMGAMIFSLCQGLGPELVAVGISNGHVLAAIKKAMAPPRRKGRLETLDRALGVTPISVEARLGRVDLSFAELSTLAPGDVLVLNTRIGEPAEVLVGGHRIAAGIITDDEERLSLTIEA